jgi:spermidine/putrescine transport system permease protein
MRDRLAGARKGLPGAPLPAGGDRSAARRAGRLSGTRWGGYFMAAPLTLLVAALLLLPIGTFLVYSFLTPSPFRVGLPFTLENYRLAFTDRIYWRLMLNSVRIGLTTAAISTLLGYALAYYASFRAGKVKVAVLALTVVSILGGYLVRIYAWRIVLGTEGVLNSALGALGLTHNPLQFLLFSRSAVVVALVNIYIPFTALTVFAALENVGRDLIEAARDLGAGPLRAFGRVVLPLTGRAVFTSFLFVFLLTAADYITPQLVGGTSGAMIGVVVYDQFVKLGDWALGAALSFYIVIVFGLVLAVTWLSLRALGILRRGA